MKKQDANWLLLFFYLFYPNIISDAKSFNSSTDESALLSIKSHITSDPNNILAGNWSQGTSFCTWIGVTCSRRHPRVTSIDLFGMGLGGTIAPQIGKLSFLMFLDLSNNSFTGQIPDTVGNLARLREIKLYNNNLAGSVPQGIFNISSLQEISLYANQLSGILPPDMCPPLSRLQILELDINQFSGDIPRGLWSCEQLRIVILARNNFTGNLPREIGNLWQLQILALGANQLTGIIPPTIGNLSNLNVTDLSQNNFQGPIPLGLGNLSNLTILNLGSNRINGEMLSTIFNLSKLQQLSFVENELTGTIPPSIDTGLPNIQRMYLGGNMFSGEIPISISNLSQLTDFDVNNNAFIGIIPENLGNLRNLRILRLGRNHFSNNLSLPRQDFLTKLSNCSHLSTLQIGLNPITGELPQSLGNLSASLEYFAADRCRFSGKIPSEISNLNGLVGLDLGGNNLTGTIPETLGRLRNLQILLLYGNELEGSLPYSLCSLQNMFLLSVYMNKLSGHIPRCFGSLPSLRVLYLHDNSFNLTIPSTLWSSLRIEILALSGNLLEGFLPAEVGNLRSLRELYLSENQFYGSIPSSIGELSHLQTLWMQNNRFNGSIPQSFSDLKALRNLDLSQNHLSGSIPMSLENLLDLEYFNVSFNELSGEIPDGGNFGNFTAESFEGNRNLCGVPEFQVGACPTYPPLSSRKRHELLRYILPPIASIVVVASVVVMFLRCRGRKSEISALFDSPPGLVCKRISYYEVLTATNNLNVENLIGEGGIGLVYKGTFAGEMVAAIKVFNLNVQGAFKSFDTECQIMRSLRHRNLVKVIASCSNLDFKALIMEYMPKGNLDKLIHSSDCLLSVEQRLELMIDVGSAIEYLHRGFSAPIVHCDLKPSNILLDEDMVAHVGDFGIAKLLTEDQRMELTKTLGTIGYMAPEYGSAGLVSTKVDIYSYGILLMEAFTKKKPTDEMFVGELTMKNWVSESLRSGVMKIIDVDLFKEDEKNLRAKTNDCLTLLLELAMECASDLPEKRPVMEDVLVRLRKINIKLHAT